MALAATAQDGRIAGLEAQRTGIARHVRPALVDDADDAERHAHALDPQPVRTHPVRHDRADGIRERRDLLDADGHRLDARSIETQPVEHRATETGSLRRIHVALHWRPVFPRLARAATFAADTSAAFLRSVSASASTAAASTAARPIESIISATAALMP